MFIRKYTRVIVVGFERYISCTPERRKNRLLLLFYVRDVIHDEPEDDKIVLGPFGVRITQKVKNL